MSASRDELIGRTAAAVAAGCVIVLVATAVALSAPSIAQRLGWVQPASAYGRGERVDLEFDVYSTAERTVVFFARSSCGACQASKAVMAAIVSDLQGIDRAQAAFVTGQDDPEDERFAREIGITGSRLTRTNLGRLRLRYVPTVVVTDAKGVVLFVREGVLTETDRSEIAQLFVTPLRR